jgi:hypothetical protein
MPEAGFEADFCGWDEPGLVARTSTRPIVIRTMGASAAVVGTGAVASGWRSRATSAAFNGPGIRIAAPGSADSPASVCRELGRSMGADLVAPGDATSTDAWDADMGALLGACGT